MNCFQIEVRGVTFTVWAPNLREAVETFMIDMDFFEVPKDMMDDDYIPSRQLICFLRKLQGFKSPLDCLRKIIQLEESMWIKSFFLTHARFQGASESHLRVRKIKDTAAERLAY